MIWCVVMFLSDSVSLWIESVVIVFVWELLVCGCSGFYARVILYLCFGFVYFDCVHICVNV